MLQYMNRNLQGLQRSGIRRYTALAQDTPDCVLLTIGEPEACTPEPIREACAAALASGRTHYSENQGTASLRAAISAWETENRGLDYKPEEVLVTAGATEAVYCALTGVLNPGDEVIIPTPAFGLYDTVTRLAGARPVPVDTAPAGFHLTGSALAAALTPRTRAVVLCSPNNPTGVACTWEDLLGIRRALEDRPVFLLCDDVYRGLCYNDTCPDPARLPGLRDRLLIAQSFSKPWAMTGWRVGYLLGDRPVIEKLTVLHGHTMTCVSTMLQDACETALKCSTRPMLEEYRQRRALVLERLHRMGLPCPVPDGAFYVFPDICAFGLSGDVFCRRMIQEAGVAAVPGSCFGAEGYIRLSYCCSPARLALGLDRMERFVEKLRQETAGR